ncbi:MAG: hypothetical protein QM758_20555 [Armatimonas sp.]
MTLTIEYSPQDLEAYANNYYDTEEGKAEWKTWQAQATRGWLLLSFLLFRSIPLFLALLWTVGTTVLAYVLIDLYRPLYVRQKAKSYGQETTRSTYSLTLTQEGIRYTEQGNSVTYSWSTLRKIESLPDNSLNLFLLNSSFYIPPGAFLDPMHRKAFLKVLEDGQRGETINPWWTQNDTASPHS